MYNPDRWTIVKITSAVEVYKIISGWSGGYLGSDSWSISSGLVEVTLDGDFYIMKNHSGSIYRCHKDCEGFTFGSMNYYETLKAAVEEAGYSMGTIDVEDYLKL